MTVILSRWQHAHTQRLLSVLTLILTFRRQRIKCLRQPVTNKTSGMCVSGRPDSEKCDFLSASRLQLFRHQMRLGLHECLNQDSLGLGLGLHTFPSHHLPTRSLWHRVLHVLYHPLIANKHPHILSFSIPSFSVSSFLLPQPRLTTCSQPGCCDPVGISSPLSQWQTFRLILTGRVSDSDREKVDQEQRRDRTG